MHCVGVPLSKYIIRIYSIECILVYFIYESIASRAYCEIRERLKEQRKKILEGYILAKIFLISIEVLLFQKMH